MPRVSEFYGIAIYIYYQDHGPPHFHAIYGGFEAQVAIEGGDVLRGALPRRATGLVRKWARRYQKELELDWQRAAKRKELEGIPPLE